MFSRPLTISCLNCCTCSLSLRLALYHLPRVSTGCSDTVSLSTMQNLVSLSTPLTMEMLRDLLGLIFIRDHLMFSCSFPSSYLVDAAVVVSVVMLSMYALIGGRRSPALVRSPPTTHFEALMMTSMAIVKAKGETVQPAMMPTSKCCHAVPLVHGKKQKIPTGVHGELNQMHWPG